MLFKYFKKNDLVKNTLTLLSGTVLAQFLLLAISPLLTRLYSPEDFGVFALYISIVTLINVIATARYEFALMQPKNNDDAINILILCIFISFVVGLISFLLILLFKEQIIGLLTSDVIEPWLYLVPLSVFLSGCYQSLSYWHNRKKDYTAIAKTKVSQSVVTASINLGAANVKVESFGLIVGQFVGQLSSVIFLTKRLKFNLFADVDFKKILKLAVKYKKYPLVSSPGALMNSAALQWPVLFITRTFDYAAVGYFNFVYRIIGGPLALISSSLSQVLLQKIASKDYENLNDLVLVTAKRLFLFSTPFVLVIVLFGPELFGFIFGDKWVVAGEYSRILIFSIAVRFVVSPLSMVLVMEQFVKWAFFWQLYTLCSVVATTLLASNLDVYQFLVVFVIQDVVSYLLYFALIIKATKHHFVCG